MMGSQRDYDRELADVDGHKYAYGFDFDVMHGYMVDAFRPFFRPGKMLELGSFRGDFTRRLLEEFDEVTCVEASAQAAATAQQRLGDRAAIITGTFESVQLGTTYENIVMTHVLEHVDDPVSVLRRINREWLSPGGRFFLACPNANAASRQIAVKMGLIRSVEEAAQRQHTPKIAFVAPPISYTASSGKHIEADDIDLLVRALSMGQLHHAMMGTAAVAIGTAAAIPGTLVNRAAGGGTRNAVVFGHPSGTLRVGAEAVQVGGHWQVTKALMSRSARILMEGWVRVPADSF